MPTRIQRREKCTAAFLGAALGDAFGWPYESSRRTSGNADGPEWTRKVGSHFDPWVEVVRLGEYSDDTQLILATARSLLKEGKFWTAHFCNVELPAWRIYERGGGRATKAAATLLAEGQYPWNASDVKRRAYFDAGGNGAAMRILPHVVHQGEDRQALIRDVILNSVCTHGHPRAIVGALSHALALENLFMRSSTLEYGELITTVLEQTHELKFECLSHAFAQDFLSGVEEQISVNKYAHSWDATINEMLQMLELALQETRKGALASEGEYLRKIGALETKTNGAGTVSAAAAIFLAARYAVDPGAGLKNIVRMRGLDTDTVGSMACSLLAAVNGEAWLSGEAVQLQDFDYIRGIADKLFSFAESASVSSSASFEAPPLKAPRINLDRLLETPQVGSSIEIPLIGSVTVTRLSEQKDRHRQTVARIYVVRAFDGQTLHLRAKLKLPARRGVLVDLHEDSPTKIGIRFYTRNLAAVRKFYESVLGLIPEKCTDATVVYSPNVVFADANLEGKLLFHQPDEASAIVIEVRDFERLQEKLRSHRIRVESTPTRSNRQMLVLRDPDERRIEIFASRVISPHAEEST